MTDITSTGEADTGESATPLPTHAPWWNVMQLRPEIIGSEGVISDTRVSLRDVSAPGSKSPHSDPDHYGAITHPTGNQIDLMARVATRLAVLRSTQTEAVWRLNQAMGGGKSHNLVGLWHLATHPRRFVDTDLGRQALSAALDITGQPLPADLRRPTCVVLDCDNTTPTEDDFGPARTLGERFLWRLFDGDSRRYDRYRRHTSNKSQMREALGAAGRPVLILIDEIMDYLRVAAISDPDGAVLDIAFLRSILEAVNLTANCAAAVVMIDSDQDSMAMTDLGNRLRGEMEDLLNRNASTAAVTSGGDFAEIIRRRLFTSAPPKDVVDQVANSYVNAISPHWRRKVFDKLTNCRGVDFRDELWRSYPFHPQLMALAERDWSTRSNFQGVRSAIRLFALAAYQQSRRGREGRWAPQLIDSGDLSLGFAPLREMLLNCGLVADRMAQGHLREVATTDIADTHHPGRGTARRLDLARHQTLSWVMGNPRASERMATAMFVRSLGPGAGGHRGITEAEMLAASFVSGGTYEIGEAEAVFRELLAPGRGLASIDYTSGRGCVPRRWFFETGNTLEMLTRAEKQAVTEADRDQAVTDRAFEVAMRGGLPFDEVIPIAGGPVPEAGVTLDGCLEVLRRELADSRTTRLAILDSRWFSLFGRDDSVARQSLSAAFGADMRGMAVEWASSMAFACANNALRAQARGLASEWLARRRVADMSAVRADPISLERAEERASEALRQLDKRVRLCYRHIVYLAPEGRRPPPGGIHQDRRRQTLGSRRGGRVGGIEC